MTNVLIDTQVFHSHRFDFTRADFKRLEEVVDDGKVRVLITKVIDREVCRKITEESIAAQQALRNTLKQHAVLQHSPKLSFHTLVAKGALADLTAARLAQWEAWKSVCQVEEVPVEDIDVDAIVDAYFDVKPPFGSGGKKAEFPDAITLAAVSKWSAEESEHVTVISLDRDLRAFCEAHETLHHLDTLAVFLERFSAPYIVAEVIKALDELQGDMIAKAGEEFEGGDFVTRGIEAQVDSVTVDRVTIDSTHIIEAADGEGVAEIHFTIEYTAQIEYPDPHSGIWDSEDKKMWFQENITEDVEGDDTAILTVGFVYDEGNPGEIDIMDVTMVNRTRYVTIGNPDSDYR